MARPHPGPLPRGEGTAIGRLTKLVWSSNHRRGFGLHSEDHNKPGASRLTVGGAMILPLVGGAGRGEGGCSTNLLRRETGARSRMRSQAQPQWVGNVGRAGLLAVGASHPAALRTALSLQFDFIPNLTDPSALYANQGEARGRTIANHRSLCRRATLRAIRSLGRAANPPYPQIVPT